MQFLDCTFESPAENLACDEALLDLCEDASGGEILRFWEPKTYFVVLGYSNKMRTEVHLDSCRQDKILILRRASGGGTVLQGPGCLNFSLILQINGSRELKNISTTNRLVLERHQKALSGLRSGIEVRGISDLALGDMKFSGNAQRRKRKALLFHGTFLLDFDLPKISRALALPAKRPSYRGDRSHEDFLTNLKLPAQAVKDCLKKIWKINGSFSEIPGDGMGELLREKYSREEWNGKF